MTIEKIEDEIIEQIKIGIPTLKTVDTFEADYDLMEIKKFLFMTPFVLVHYAARMPVQTLADGSAAIEKCEFDFYVGSKSLRNKREAQAGDYTILDALRNLFSGARMTIDGEMLKPFEYLGEQFVSSLEGIVVYKISFSLYL